MSILRGKFRPLLTACREPSATLWCTASAAASACLPFAAHAQEAAGAAAGQGIGAGAFLAIFLGFLALTAFLSRAWMGIVNVALLENEPLASIERRQPYLPSARTIIAAVLGTVLLLAISLKTIAVLSPFQGPSGPVRALAVLAALGIAAAAMPFARRGAREILFAGIIGTVMSFILIAFTHTLFLQATQNDPFFMTLGVVAIVLIWRFLFGPWEARVKAAVLGTFVFWIAANTLAQETPKEQLAHVIAIAIAAVPALVWCLLFLPYHRERLRVVFLMFFSGMVATAPVLFYDALVRSKVEMQLFVLRIVPESFNVSVQSFLLA
ncbi:MAG: hypothetical protein PHI23_04945, partial [Candidatus Peribacteraceae bacterium]|nr:hypothetical protein [Candidatus Peribacteraceae bacterium]